MRVKINEWWSNNEPDEKLIYKDGLAEQCLFVRDTLMLNLFIDIATDYLKYGDYSDERNEIVSVGRN